MFKSTEDETDNELIAQIKSNLPETQNAKQTLYSRHSPLIYSIVWNVLKRGNSTVKNRELYEDLYQEACIAFFEAIQKFDSTRSVKFTTFAWQYIFYRVQTIMFKEFTHRNSIDNSKIFSTSGLMTCASDDQSDIEPVEIAIYESGYEEIETAQINDQVDEFILSLPSREQTYLRKIFWDTHSKSDVARNEKVSPKMVGKIVGKALIKGRKHFLTNPYLM